MPLILNVWYIEEEHHPKILFTIMDNIVEKKHLPKFHNFMLQVANWHKFINDQAITIIFNLEMLF